MKQLFPLELWEKADGFQWVYLDDIAVFYNFTQQLSVLAFILLLFQFCGMLQENDYFFKLLQNQHLYSATGTDSDKRKWHHI